MLKIAIVAALAAAMIPIGALIWIDRLARLGVERGATYALGVATTVDSVNIGLLDGRVGLTQLQVANPDGFAAPHFMQLDAGHLAVDMKSLVMEQVEAPELTLSDVSLSLESRKGKANYAVILDNLKKLQSKTDSSNSQGKRFTINKVAINNITVDVELLPVGGQLTRMPVKIEKIELNNVGADSDRGVLMAELSEITIQAILTTVLRQAGHVLPKEITQGLETGLAELTGLGEITLEVVGHVTHGVGEVALEIGKTGIEIGQTVGKGVEDVGKEIGKGLEDVGNEIGKGLEDLLGGKKKKKQTGTNNSDANSTDDP